MAVLSSSTFTGADYAPLESYSGELNAVWSRPTTGNYPNQVLISTADRIFRSAYCPEIGVDCPDGSEHFLQAIGLATADYLVKADLWWLGDYVTGSGAAQDEPDGFGGRLINTSGKSNNTTSPISSNRVELYGRWTLPYSGYAIRFDTAPSASYRGSSPGAHGTGIIGGITVEGSGGEDSPPFDEGAPTFSLIIPSTDPTIPPLVTIGVVSFDPIPNQAYSIQLRMRGSTISAWIDGQKVIEGTDTTFTTHGIVGLRFDGGSSPVKGIHLDNYVVSTDFTDPPAVTENLDVCFRDGGSKHRANEGHQLGGDVPPAYWGARAGTPSVSTLTHAEQVDYHRFPRLKGM